jgi:hypothetical protein
MRTAEAIVIHRPRLVRVDGWTRLEARVDNLAATDRIWFAVENAYADHLEQAGSDGFLLAVLPVAIRSGQDVHLEAALSTKLYYSTEMYLIPFLVELSIEPATRIHVFATDLVSRPLSPAVAAPFSGGLDSFTTLAEHHFASVPAAYRLTHLSYHNVGSHSVGTHGDALFHARRTKIARAADELELPLVLIDSNLHHFIRGRFTASHTLRQLGAAHAMSGLFGKVLMASGASYTDVRVRRGDAIGYSDPVHVHLLSSEAMECISSGVPYTRFEKTRLVSELELSYRYLDVCVSQDFDPTVRPNCSRCKKCVRTMVMLDILGKLERYEAVFDLDAWRREGPRRLAPVIGAGGVYAREINHMARRYGYRIPLSSRVLALGWRVALAMPVPTRRRFRALLRGDLRRGLGRRSRPSNESR